MLKIAIRALLGVICINIILMCVNQSRLRNASSDTILVFNTSSDVVVDFNLLMKEEKRLQEQLTVIKHNSAIGHLFHMKYANPCWYSNATKVELRCLPRFLVAGVCKSGTTELFDLLQKHPMIVPSDVKEVNFWTTLWATKPPIDVYTKFFQNATKAIFETVASMEDKSWYHPVITYEATPSMFWEAPKGWSLTLPLTRLNADDIHAFLPDVKIIVTLRNPTSRLYSDYNHFINKSPEDFHQRVLREIGKHTRCRKKYSVRLCAYAIQAKRRSNVALHIGMYDVYAKDWLRIFKDNIYFSKLEDFSKDRSTHLNKMFRFLNLADSSMNIDDGVSNKGNYKTGPMLNTTKVILDKFYKPHLQALATLLGDDKYLWQ